LCHPPFGRELSSLVPLVWWHRYPCSACPPILGLSTVQTLRGEARRSHKSKKVEHKTKGFKVSHLSHLPHFSLLCDSELIHLPCNYMLTIFTARTSQAARRSAQSSNYFQVPQRARMATLGAPTRKHKVTIIGSGNW